MPYQKKERMTRIAPRNITAVILAGGKSRRMGQDKGLLKYKGIAFCSHIIAAALPCCTELIVVSNQQEYAQFGYPMCSDNLENKGPLGGLEAGINASTKTFQLVLSCDMPLLSTALLKKLCVQTPNRPSICMFIGQNQKHPFPGLYHSGLILPIRQTIEANQLGLLAFIASQSQHIIDVTAGDEKQLLNINYLKDYHQLKHDHQT